MTKRGTFRKGEKLVRIYGSNSWGSPFSMKPGDIGTVAEDQIYPGEVAILEYPGYHDPIRFRRKKELKGLSPKNAAALYALIQNHDFDGVLKLMGRTQK